MRISIRLACWTLLVALAARPAGATPPAFTFLEVPAGARASALGGAFATLSEGVEAGLWNPAGLAHVEGVEVAGSHFETFQHLRHDQFSLARPLLGGGIAASLRAFYSAPIVARDDLGNETGTFGGHDLAFGLAYGRPLGGGVRVGGVARVVREKIAELSAGTFAFGAGLTWQPAERPVRFGAMVDHLGPDAHYTFSDGQGQPLPLPRALQAGGAWRRGLTSEMTLETALEARMVAGRAGIGMVGAELTHRSGAALRLGVRIHDDQSRLSAGAGYAMKSLRLDYAFVADRLDVGDSHRVSFTARF